MTGKNSIISILALVLISLSSIPHDGWAQKPEFRPNCYQLNREFEYLKSDLIHHTEGSTSLSQLQSEYDKRMAIFLAYKGLRNLIDNFLHRVMGYQETMSPQAKIQQLDQVLGSIDKITAMSEFLKRDGFDLSEFLSQNQSSKNSKNFINQMVQHCQKPKKEKSSFCSMLFPQGLKAEANTSVVEMLENFYQLALVGNFQPHHLENFSQFFISKKKNTKFSFGRYINLFGKKKNELRNSGVTKINRQIISDLRNSLQDLIKCKAKSIEQSQCYTAEQLFRREEEKLNSYQQGLNNILKQQELANFSLALQGSFQSIKSFSDPTLFYDVIHNMNLKLREKELYKINMEMKATLIQICGGIEEVSTSYDYCRVNRHFKSASPALIKKWEQIKTNKIGIENKIRKESKNIFAESVIKTSAPHRQGWRRWIEKNTSSPLSRRAWHLLQQSSNLQCVQLLTGDPKISIQECLNSVNEETDKNKKGKGITKEDKKEMKNLLSKFKKDSQQLPLKENIKGVHHYLHTMSLHYLTHLFSAKQKKGPLSPLISLCPTLKNVSAAEAIPSKVSFKKVITCLQEMQKKPQAALIETLEKEMVGILHQIKNFQQSPKMQASLIRLQGYAKALTQTGCQTSQEVQGEIDKAIGPSCSLPQKTSMFSNISNLSKITDFLNRKKNKKVSNKQLFALMSSPDEPLPQSIERYHTGVLKDKITRKILKKREGSSFLPYLTGFALGIPGIFPVLTQTFSLQSAHHYASYMGEQTIWRQHYWRLANEQYQNSLMNPSITP